MVQAATTRQARNNRGKKAVDDLRNRLKCTAARILPLVHSRFKDADLAEFQVRQLKEEVAQLKEKNEKLKEENESLKSVPK